MDIRVIGWCAVGNNCANSREGLLSLFNNCAHGEETFATVEEAEARIKQVVGKLDRFDGPDDEQLYHASDAEGCGCFELQKAKEE